MGNMEMVSMLIERTQRVKKVLRNIASTIAFVTLIVLGMKVYEHKDNGLKYVLEILEPNLIAYLVPVAIIVGIAILIGAINLITNRNINKLL